MPMSAPSLQAPSAVVMIRPHRVHPNPETAQDDTFQQGGAGHTRREGLALSNAARDEVSAAAARLQEAGIEVHVFDDPGEHDTPDSVFPNNWFSTHGGGHIALYPMCAPNRRRERRGDIIDMLKAAFIWRAVPRERARGACRTLGASAAKVRQTPKTAIPDFSPPPGGA